MRFINLGTDLGAIDSKQLGKCVGEKAVYALIIFLFMYMYGQQNFPLGDNKNEQGWYLATQGCACFSGSWRRVACDVQQRI